VNLAAAGGGELSYRHLSVHLRHSANILVSNRHSFLPALLRPGACMVCVVALVAIVPSLAQRGSDGTRLQHIHGLWENDWSELMASMDKMHDAIASIKSSGDSDVDFVKLMLPHHQAAIDMAKIQLIYAKSPEMVQRSGVFTHERLVFGRLK